MIWYGKAGNTVLGETEDKKELLPVDCQDKLLHSLIVLKCEVRLKPCIDKEEWRRLGRQVETSSQESGGGQLLVSVLLTVILQK